MSKAIAAVAAEIIPVRPPTIAVIKAIQKEAYRPTFGSTPAIIEKAMASGISAKATTSPARISPRVLPNQSRRDDENSIVCPHYMELRRCLTS